MTVERFVSAVPVHAGPAAASVGADLVERWSEPHRRYHDLRHLDTVLSIVDANARLVPDATAVRLAAWFHDAVYDPTAGSGANEEASAQLAVQALGLLGVDPATIDEVARLVRLTADHDPAPSDQLGCLLTDADLAILAAEPDDYAAYAQAIRVEYGHVPDALYRVGRAAVLRHLETLDPLYRIVPARNEWTAAAHRNLRAELAGLDAS